MPTGLDELRREDSYGAVVCGEGLVELGHPPADAGQALHHVHLDSHIREVERGLDTGNPTAYDRTSLLIGLYSSTRSVPFNRNLPTFPEC